MNVNSFTAQEGFEIFGMFLKEAEDSVEAVNLPRSPAKSLGAPLHL